MTYFRYTSNTAESQIQHEIVLHKEVVDLLISHLPLIWLQLWCFMGYVYTVAEGYTWPHQATIRHGKIIKFYFCTSLVQQFWCRPSSSVLDVAFRLIQSLHTTAIVSRIRPYLIRFETSWYSLVLAKCIWEQGIQNRVHGRLQPLEMDQLIQFYQRGSCSLYYS